MSTLKLPGVVSVADFDAEERFSRDFEFGVWQIIQISILVKISKLKFGQDFEVYFSLRL